MSPFQALPAVCRPASWDFSHEGKVMPTEIPEVILVENAIAKSPFMQLVRVRWWKFWNPWWFSLITGKILRTSKNRDFVWREKDA